MRFRLPDWLTRLTSPADQKSLDELAKQYVQSQREEARRIADMLGPTVLGMKVPQACPHFPLGPKPWPAMDFEGCKCSNDCWCLTEGACLTMKQYEAEQENKPMTTEEVWTISKADTIGWWRDAFLQSGASEVGLVRREGKNYFTVTYDEAKITLQAITDGAQVIVNRAQDWGRKELARLGKEDPEPLG
jgi:hypothetical protein